MSSCYAVRAMVELRRRALAGTAALGLALSWTQAASAQVAKPPSVEATPLLPPELVSRAEATYPPEALRDRREATVGLEIVIDERGRVEEARVLSPAGHGFDESALEAVRRFVFQPGRRGPAAIRSTVQLAYEFHLPPPSPDRPVARPIAPPLPPAAVEPPAVAPLAVQTGPNQSTLVIASRPLHASVQETEHIAASDSTTSQAEIALRPRFRDAEGIVDAVPGLFTLVNAGGGKAQQYFLRGFDADHGTDIAFFVDGAPINAVSHAHGQGFSDLHFLIPEVIDTLESTKGPYSVRAGDFATAGTVGFHMADHLPESVARVDLGPDGYKRAVAVESPNLGPGWRLTVAAEAFDDSGPFIHPENFDRLNGYLKVTRVLDERSELSFMLMGYGGSWNMSGLIPVRAVCGESDGTPTPAAYAGSHCLSRWDSPDPSQGGTAQRFMAQTSYRHRFDSADLEAMVFAVRSNLQIFPNDGISAAFQPEGILYGSQIEQDDARTELGASFRLSKRLDIEGLDVRTSVGVQLRDDVIESQLHRTLDRVRLDVKPGIVGPITDSGINESELGAHAEVDWRLTRWLRFVLGGRFDRIDAGVNNESQTAIDPVSGYRGAGIGSPKASAVVSPVKELDLFVNYGRGFHTNDARTLAEGQATTLAAVATGAETGAALRPFNGLALSAVGFVLDLTSELTIDGDTASTSPSGSTRRYGAELVGRYNFRKDIYADASFTVTHAQYTDAADIAAHTTDVPLAPIRTFNAGVGVREPIGPVTVYGSVRVKSMSDRPATQDGTLTATGFTLFDAAAGARWKAFEVGFDLLNIANVAWREAQVAVNSRLPGEGMNPPLGLSFAPGLPRTILGHAAVYW